MTSLPVCENQSCLMDKLFSGMLLVLLFVLPLFEAPKNLVAFGLLILGIVALFIRRQKLTLLQQLFLIWILVAGVVTLNTVISYGYDAEGFRDIFRTVAIGFVIATFATVKVNEKTLLFVTLMGAVLALFWGIYERFYTDVLVVELNSVGHPNHSSIYLQLCLSMALPIMLFSESKLWFKLALTPFLLLLMLGILMMESRAVIAAMGLVILFSVFAAVMIRKWWVLYGLVVCLVLSLFTVGNVYENIVEKHQFWIDEHLNDKDGHLTPRRQINTMSIFIAKEFPVLGIGFENYTDFTQNKLRPMLEEKGEELPNVVEGWLLGMHPHNTYFDHLTASGIIGFSVFVIFFGIVLRHLWRYRPQKTSGRWQVESRWLSVAFITFSILTIGLFNSSFRHENALLTIILLTYFLTRYPVNSGSEEGSES